MEKSSALLLRLLFPSTEIRPGLQIKMGKLLFTKMASVTFISNISALLLLSVITFAQDCSNPTTQMDMNFCAKMKFEQTERQLNMLYRSIHDRLSEEGKSKLELTEIEWLKYRNLQCDAAMDEYQGGSIAPLVKFGCLTSLTEQRIKTLQ